MILIKYGVPLALSLSLFGCGKSSNTADATGSAIKNTTVTDTKGSATNTAANAGESTLPDDAPTYRLALDNDYPPFSFKDEYGVVIGYEIETLRAAGEAAGFKVDAMPVPWDGIFDLLEDGSVDIVGGTAVTPERLETYEMANPMLIVT